MSLKKLKNRLKAEGVKFDDLCAMPEGTTLRVGKGLDWHCLVSGIDKKAFAADVAFAIAMDAANDVSRAHGMQG